MVLEDLDNLLNLDPIFDLLGSPTKLIVTGNKPELREDFERFFKEVDGLEPLAKQAGLLDSNGEILLGQTSETLIQSQPANSQGVQFVYIASPNKQILPKTEPVVVQTNQAPIHVQRVHSYTTNPPLKRPAEGHTITVDALDSKRPRKSEKGGKGLRHFSMKVCEKVEAKGITTYNEVAEELVEEFTDPRNAQSEQAQYDQKNIRRRVYDALNVLMAMNIISKEKKEIRWIGLPTNSAQEYQSLEVEKTNRLERIKQKEQKLQELVIQQIAYKNLVNRNSQLEKLHGVPPENSKIQLPFVIVNTNKKTVIDCSISHDKYEYLFNFDNTFEIHDDIEVLKRMGLTFGLEKGVCSREDMEKAVEMLPKSLEPYVRRICPSAKSASAVSPSTSSMLTIKPGTSSNQPTYIQVPITYQQ